MTTNKLSTLMSRWWYRPAGGEWAYPDAWSSLIKTPGHGRPRDMRRQAALDFLQHHLPELQVSVQPSTSVVFEDGYKHRIRKHILIQIPVQPTEIYMVAETCGWRMFIRHHEEVWAHALNNSFDQIKDWLLFLLQNTKSV